MLTHSELLDNWARYDKAAAPTEQDILREFYTEVCDEAEKIMAQTNTVSGAHWNAMKRVLKRHGVEVAS